MKSHEAAIRASHDPWSETAGSDAHGDVLLSAWEAVLHEEHTLTAAEVANAVLDEAPIESEVSCTYWDDVIVLKVKYAVKEMVTTKWRTMVREFLEEILRTSFHNEQSGIPAAVYSVFEKVMLDLLREDTIGGTLDAKAGKLFHTDAAAEGLSKRLQTWSMCLEPTATVVRRREGT